VACFPKARLVVPTPTVITTVAVSPVTITNRGDAVSYYLISPAISNGLSFNKKTGDISGVPIEIMIKNFKLILAYI
jgi:hypothetical protein